MRDEPGPRRRFSAVLLVLVFLWPMSGLEGLARAQSLRGSTQVQYQRLDGPGVDDDREIWLSALQVDVTKRFEERLDLSGQILFRGVNYAGRPEGTQTPRGTLRLSHRYFGASGSYRPVRITDPLGITSHQDELQFSAYSSRERWPTVTATWLRRANRPSEDQPQTVGIARTLAASQDFGGRLQLHAGYSDQGKKSQTESARSNWWRTLMGGAATRLGSPRAQLLAQLDVTETRSFVNDALTDRILTEALSLNGGVQHSRRHGSSLTYAFRRTEGENGAAYTLDDHDGVALTRYAFTRAISLSGGGGVRSIRTVADRELQSYVLAIASADGPIRPGWTGGVGVSRSWNWTRDSQAKPIDTYQANTRMRLADGLDVTAAGQVNVSELGGGAQVDSLGRTAGVVAQASASITARPLRPITGTYSRRTYRAGETLTGPAATSIADAIDVRWNPSAALQLWGSVARTHGVGRDAPRLLVRQANAQWNPSRRLELSGNWWRSDETRPDPNAALPPGRETRAGRLLLGLTRDLKTIVILSVVDPGRPTKTTRIEATATLGFGR